MNFFVHGQVNSIQTFVSASPALKVFLMDSDINPEKEWSAGKYESSYILLLHGVDVSDSKPNADKGLEWGPYFGNGFRWVRINKDFDRSSLKKRGIDAYAFLNTEPVISGLISKENFKEVYSDTRQWKINVRVFRGFESSFVNDALVLHLEVKKLGGSYFEIDIDSAMVRKVLTLPYVMEIEPAWMPAMAVNYDNRGVHGLNILKNTLTGMRGLSGRNVYVGVGDDGNITSHIDYKDRVTDRASYAYSNHATHVGGTVGGAGLLNPRDEGMAPRVSLIGEYFTNIISATENHIRDFNMVLTNNSYHSALTTCAGNGDYGSASEFSDEQQYENDTFYWNTDCSHIRSQFYSVVINASDNFSVGTTRVPLVDLETWLIRVIAPAPENVTATPFGNAITINWQNPYSCSTAPNFRSFSVWRKIGSNPFIPDSCETGLAGRGYEKIADGLTDYRYRDADVVRGQVYCYRVLAHFSKLSPNGLVEYDNAESIPSNEVCAELKKDVPVLLHADVIKTDTVNGQVFVDWSMPRIPDLDTIQNPGPYKFELKRSIGIGGSSFISIRTFNSLTFDGLRVDTFYTDSLINTLQNPHTYTVDFFTQSDSIIGSTNPGSTVFLQLFSGDKQIRLDWSESVPWTNYIYYIYKSIDTGVSFVFLDSISSQSYLDTGLNNGSLYCYYVESYGVYSSRGYVKPLINKSQRLCSVPIDTVPPCAPVLRVSNDCGLITDNAWGPSNFVNIVTGKHRIVTGKQIGRAHV